MIYTGSLLLMNLHIALINSKSTDESFIIT